MSPVIEFATGALVSIAISATLVWLLTGLVALAWLRASAATRHRLWGISMVAVLAAPVVVTCVPIPRWFEWNKSTLPAGEIVAPAGAEQPSQSTTAVDLARLPHAAIRGDANQPAEADPTSTVASGTAEHPVASSLLPWFLRKDRLTQAAYCWFAGIVVSLALALSSSWRCAGLVRDGMPVNAQCILETCARLCRDLGIRRPVFLTISAETTIPFVSGWRQPVVVLPAGYGAWPADRLRVVLTHELIHIRRADLAWQFVASLCLALAWFHPLAWLAKWRLRVEREHACDDAVIALGERPSDYATHLVEIAAELRAGHRRLAPKVAIANCCHVENRVRSILDPRASRLPAGHFLSAVAALASLLPLAISAAFAPSFSRPPQQQPPPATGTFRAFAPETEENPSVDGQAVAHPPRGNGAADDMPGVSDTKDQAPVGKAQKPDDSSKQLTLPETIENLKSQGKTDEATFLTERWEIAKKNRKLPGPAVIFGRLLVGDPDNPRLCDAQMEIHKSGWFLGDVGNVKTPVEFRMWGYHPAQVVHGGDSDSIVAVGDVVLKRFLFDELATVRAEILFEGKVDPSQTTVEIIMKHPTPNTPSGGTDGFIPRPDKELVALGPDFRIQRSGLTPIPHFFSIKAPGHLPFRREFQLDPGGTTDVGVLRIAASPEFEISFAIADALDFTNADRRKQTVFAGDFFKTNSTGKDWVEAGTLRILEKKRTYSFHCSVSGLVVSDLGAGSLDDFLKPAKPEIQKPESIPRAIEDGHVYLISHTHKPWKHWTLMHVRMPSSK